MSLRQLAPHITPIADTRRWYDGPTRVSDSRTTSYDGTTTTATRAVFAEGFDLYLDYGIQYGGWVYSIYSYPSSTPAQMAKARLLRRKLERFGYRHNPAALDDVTDDPT